MRQSWNFSNARLDMNPQWAAVEMLEEIRDLLERIAGTLETLPTCGQLRQHLDATAKKIREPKRKKVTP